MVANETQPLAPMAIGITIGTTDFIAIGADMEWIHWRQLPLSPNYMIIYSLCNVIV